MEQGKLTDFLQKSRENKLINAREAKQKKQEKVEKLHYCNKLFNADVKENIFLFFFFSLLGKGGPFSNKVARSSDRFTFDDIFSGRFSPAGYSCQWVSGWYHFSVKSS